MGYSGSQINTGRVGENISRIKDNWDRIFGEKKGHWESNGNPTRDIEDFCEDAKSAPLSQKQELKQELI